MRVVRRSHLYAGLFMTPWVFLYGFTALLFNHQGAFPDVEIIEFETAQSAGTPLAEVPTPEALAARVVDTLNSTGQSSADQPTYRLVRPDEAKYTRDLFAVAHGEGVEYSTRIDPVRHSGSVRVVTERAKTPLLFPTPATVKLDPPPFEPVTRALPAILENLEIKGRDPSIRSTPDLSFLMEARGKTWRASYNTQLGKVSGRLEEDPAPLSLRRYLILLHVAHGFPAEVNWRWVWAVAVDLMFVSMMGWGITGLLMWWQMKNVRRVGVVVLLLSALVAAVMAIGMHGAFQA